MHGVQDTNNDCRFNWVTLREGAIFNQCRTLNNNSIIDILDETINRITSQVLPQGAHP